MQYGPISIYDHLCVCLSSLPVPFQSSQTHHHRHSPSGQTGPERACEGSCSRESQRSPTDARTSSRSLSHLKKRNGWRVSHSVPHSLLLPGKFSQRTSMGVDLFVSPIFWYLSFSVSALSPCQGRLPRRKYMNMWPSASRSSRRLCSKDKDRRRRRRRKCKLRNNKAIAIKSKALITISLMYTHTHTHLSLDGC